jgi:hypothetical protein
VLDGYSARPVERRRSRRYTPVGFSPRDYTMGWRAEAVRRSQSRTHAAELTILRMFI